MSQYPSCNERSWRRSWQRVFLAALALPTLVACEQAPPPDARQSAERPNIVFIYTDDQAAWTLDGREETVAYTPHLDQLAAQGASFSNAFVTTPVCSPSRAGLLTGLYGSEVGITDWIRPQSRGEGRTEEHLGLDPAIPTWLADLENAGYDTVLVGKWHLGTRNHFHPTHFGYDRFMGFQSPRIPPRDPVVEVLGRDRAMEGLTVDVLTKLALQSLKEQVARQPFLLSIHYRAPHPPWLPVAEEDMAAYVDGELSLPDPDFPDLAVERVERAMREYLASVTGIDRNVGRILSLLSELGISDDTIVIFTSDNGYNIGHHGLIGKGNGTWATMSARGKSTRDVVRSNLFDTSLRVPCIVRWPGVVEPGTTIERVFTNLDWYPTLLAMAAVDASASSASRGRNAVPLLRGEDVTWDDTFYGEYAIHHYTRADLRMLRTRHYKLVRDLTRPERDELYDLANDPEELNNVIGHVDYAETLAELDAELKARIAALRRRFRSRAVGPR